MRHKPLPPTPLVEALDRLATHPNFRAVKHHFTTHSYLVTPIRGLPFKLPYVFGDPTHRVAVLHKAYRYLTHLEYLI